MCCKTIDFYSMRLSTGVCETLLEQGRNLTKPLFLTALCCPMVFLRHPSTEEKYSKTILFYSLLLSREVLETTLEQCKNVAKHLVFTAFCCTVVSLRHFWSTADQTIVFYSILLPSRVCEAPMQQCRIVAKHFFKAFCCPEMSLRRCWNKAKCCKTFRIYSILLRGGVLETLLQHSRNGAKALFFTAFYCRAGSVRRQCSNAE